MYYGTNDIPNLETINDMYSFIPEEAKNGRGRLVRNEKSGERSDEKEETLQVYDYERDQSLDAYKSLQSPRPRSCYELDAKAEMAEDDDDEKTVFEEGNDGPATEGYNERPKDLGSR